MHRCVDVLVVEHHIAGLGDGGEKGDVRIEAGVEEKRLLGTEESFEAAFEGSVSWCRHEQPRTT